MLPLHILAMFTSVQNLSFNTEMEYNATLKFLTITELRVVYLYLGNCETVQLRIYTKSYI